MPTDSERLDWLEERGNGCGVVHNDQAHWAFADGGMQNIEGGDEPFDLQAAYFVEKKAFRPTLREAIDAAIDCDGDFEMEDT